MTTITTRIPAKRNPTILRLTDATLTVGTQVLTYGGERLVEDLKAGDQVVTKDFGLQKVKYISFQDVDLRARPSLAPIKVTCSHIGLGRLSHFAPDQKFALRHPMFEVMFGASEVLLRCGDATDHPGFETVTGLASLTYVALGFAKRHILSCDGFAVDVGPANQKPTRMCLGPEEARLALQVLEPKAPQAKRQGFPLH